MNDWLTFDEYAEWLEENKNKEEAAALEVAKRITEYHDMMASYSNYKRTFYFKPRHITVLDLGTHKEKLEFDLLIWMKHERDHLHRLIAVEFKESDTKTVIKQAISRRFFVDYQYIALKDIAYTGADDIMIMKYYGIGLVAWWDKPEPNAHILFPAAYHWQTREFLDVYHFVEIRLRELIEFELKKIKTDQLSKQHTLLSFTNGSTEVIKE